MVTARQTRDASGRILVCEGYDFHDREWAKTVGNDPWEDTHFPPGSPPVERYFSPRVIDTDLASIAIDRRENVRLLAQYLLQLSWSYGAITVTIGRRFASYKYTDDITIKVLDGVLYINHEKCNGVPKARKILVKHAIS